MKSTIKKVPRKVNKKLVEDEAMSDNVQSGSDEEMPSDKEEFKNSKRGSMWKLTKQKYVLMFKLCGDCTEFLYNNKKRFFRSDGRLNLAVPFCDKCLEVNIDLTDLIAPRKV
jgi:hypothetical protein